MRSQSICMNRFKTNFKAEFRYMWRCQQNFWNGFILRFSWITLILPEMMKLLREKGNRASCNYEHSIDIFFLIIAFENHKIKLFQALVAATSADRMMLPSKNKNGKFRLWWFFLMMVYAFIHSTHTHTFFCKTSV